MTGTDMIQRIRKQQIIDGVIERTLKAISDFNPQLWEMGDYNGMNLWIYTRPTKPIKETPQ